MSLATQEALLVDEIFTDLRTLVGGDIEDLVKLHDEALTDPPQFDYVGWSALLLVTGVGGVGVALGAVPIVCASATMFVIATLYLKSRQP